MWNARHLQPPPECRIKVTLSDTTLDVLMVVKAQIQRVRGAVAGHMKMLIAEHYILKRIVYKLINQMRRDKAIACLRQVNSCMKRMDEMNIEAMHETLEDYFNVDPSKIIAEEYLPCRQMLQYYLVRLMGLGALLAQTAQYCSHTYMIVKQYLGLGNLVQHYLVMMAISARVWYICRSMCVHICNLYKDLYSSVDLLKMTQVKWLPDTEELPEDLAFWIQEQFSDVSLPEITREMNKAATEQLENHMEPGFDIHGDEDLGVPVKRPKEIIAATSQDEDGDDPNNNNDKRVKRRKLTETEASVEMRTPGTGGNLPKIRIQYIKKYLKVSIKSMNDTQDLEKELRDKDVIRVGDECIALTNIGRKRILKKVRNLKKLVSEEVMEKQVLKRLRVCLAKMLVKYENTTGIASDLKVTRVKKKVTQIVRSDIRRTCEDVENALTLKSEAACMKGRKQKKLKSKVKKDKKKMVTKKKTNQRNDKDEKKAKNKKAHQKINVFKYSVSTLKNKRKKKNKD